MFNSEINIVDENTIKENILKIEMAFKRYTENYNEEQLNQILKAKENNIYLFLDDSFSVEDLRFIRNNIANKNIESFFANDEERVIDNVFVYYKFKATITEDYKYCIIEILNKDSSTWSPSLQFILEVEHMDRKKDQIMFKKIASSIYKELYPIKDPKQIENINDTYSEYIHTILYKKECDLQAALYQLRMKRLKEGYFLSPYKEYEIQKLRELVLSCKFKVDFKNELNEQEILILNKLINKNKYNLFLNKKFKV